VRRFVSVCLGLAVVASAAAAVPVAAAAVGTSAAASAAATGAAPPVALAVVGSNGALWVQAPQLGGGWHSLGGKIIGPPAVAEIINNDGSPSGQPAFFATGTDHQVWFRTLTTGWQGLGGAAPECYYSGPAAVTSSSQLTVACTGLYKQLWTSIGRWISGQPTFQNVPVSLGGVLAAAPAVSPYGEYFGLGTNGKIYISEGIGSSFTATSWRCIGQPGATADASAAVEVTIFGCEGPDHALWTATKNVDTWGREVSLGGSIISGPAIVATTSVKEFFAVGKDHAVWERTQPGGWTRLGGYAVGGVAAAALN
jgi:hypothetical protein